MLYINHISAGDYAFASVATFEYWTIKNNGSLTVLSDQQLIDCDTSNAGCKSGSPLYSMVFAINNGVADGTKYAYTSGASGKNNTCLKTYPAAYFLSNFCYVNLGGDEASMKAIIYVYGPMVLTMDGSDTALTNYKSGVFTSKKCSSASKAANLAVVRAFCDLN